jgi:hypothetical protein
MWRYKSKSLRSLEMEKRKRRKKVKPELRMENKTKRFGGDED